LPLLADIAALAVCPFAGGQGEVGLVEDAALAWEGGEIRWAGPARDVPAEFDGWPRESAGGRLVIPGLIDCHTHLAFGGDRAGEFVERLRGTSYLEIARRGGGILNTVRATRAASEDALAARARGVLGRMLRHGVTTVEAKSGYGLSLADELKTLRVYRRLADEGPQRIVPTLLGAHAVPPEYAGDRAGYLRLLTDEVIPAVARQNLARFCDAFVEEGAFTPDEARKIFAAGRAHGLPPKLHADQLSDTGGAALAAEVSAASADHLEYVSAGGIAALRAAGVVAVSLPVATLVLGQPPLPARALVEAGVPVAVATDYNPGSAPAASLPLALWLACTRQRMTPAEVLKGATIYAARALRMDAGVGSLEAGKRADFVVLDAPGVDGWLYDFREDAAVRVVAGGETAWAA
jgi:imidazolonepropionase